MRISWKSGVVASVVALAATLSVASAPAEASALSFRIKNVATGKCLKWNGTHHAITQVSCNATTMTQQWGKSGTGLITLSDSLPGQDCMTGDSNHEKTVQGRACFEVDSRRTTWRLRSYNRGDKTPIGNPLCGMLKVTASGTVTCGKKVDGDRDLWVIA